MLQPVRSAASAARAVALVFVLGTIVAAQGDVAPTNNLPNPYRTVENFFKMPPGRTWGATSAVEIDPDGRSIWVAERCGVNTCRGSNLASIFKFDASGRMVKSFGEGLFNFAHGIFVDREGNLWISDGQETTLSGLQPGETKGHQVFKFSPDGKLLMTIGRPGGALEPGYFFNPNDVLVAPDGSIFVSEGHGDSPNSRILKFAKDGTLIKTWGKKGSAPGEFNTPHALAMDSRGRLFVGDRGNNRIQIFDQEGRFLEQWKQFSRPSGLYIDRHDTLYVADSESGSVAKNHADWKRGIRIGSATDGSLRAFIPDPHEDATGTSAAEGVAVDIDGNVYGAEVGPRALKKYVKVETPVQAMPAAAQMQDRMPPIPADKMTDAQKAAVAEFKAARGSDISGPFVPLLRSPDLVNPARVLGDYLRYKTVLSLRLSELAILMTAREWTQQYIWSVHYPAALEAGLKPAIVQAIADGRRPASMAEDETLIYDICDELQRSRGLSDATYARAVSTLGEKGVIDTVAIVAFYTFIGMPLNAAHTPARGDAPPLAPLPR